MVPKGTLRAPVSPFQTTVWCYGNSEHRRFRVGVRSYKEEGEVEEEEESGGSRVTITNVHRQHAAKCKPPKR